MAETLVELTDYDDSIGGTTTSNYPIGTSGLFFSWNPTPGYTAHKGQLFAVKCFVAGKRFASGLKLLDCTDLHYLVSSQALYNVSLSKSFGNLEVPAELEDGTKNWETTKDEVSGEEGIVFYPGIKAYTIDGKLVEVTSAKIFVEYRQLLTKYSDTVHTVANTNEARTVLGAIDMDDPLAQGVYHALLNSGEQPVRFIAIKSDNLDGYLAAFARLELTEDVYSLVVMTDDDEVLTALQTHVNAMSGPETKLWRIAVVGISTDKTIAVYNNAHHKLDKEYDARVVKNEDGVTLVTFQAVDETIAEDEVWPGDKFRYAYQPDGTYTERTVDHVINNTHIVLKAREEDDPEDKEYPEQASMAKCEVYRDLTSAQWIDYVANKVSSFRDRRVYAVFPEVLWANGKKYPGYIGAAAIAGMISSVPPQQGLTNIQVKGFDDIPMTYSGYTREQLNKIAEYGGLIIMQDVPNGEVYVRHQVSTARLDGNILTTELSVTKDLDAISYYMSDILDPYIGKYNITPVLLEQIRTTVTGALNYLGSYNTGSGLLGPMLLADSEDTKIIGIRQHETIKDHIVVALSLDLPLPCNVIELYLSV